MTTRGLHHIQMHKNAICETVQTNFTDAKHISSKVNLDNILTKEDNCKSNLLTVCSTTMLPPLKDLVAAAQRIIPAKEILALGYVLTKMLDGIPQE
eukprot:13787016-Ditylum_brightwellii.AAC.1